MILSGHRMADARCTAAAAKHRRDHHITIVCEPDPKSGSEVGQHPGVALPGQPSDGQMSAVRRRDRRHRSSFM